MDPDSSSILFPFLLLIILMIINAFLSMSEIAVISLGDARARKLGQDNPRQAKRAAQLEVLTAKPSNFLATIQVGITVSGFLASAVAADTLAGRLAGALSYLPVEGGLLRAASLVVITLALSFVSLVLGELVPKRIAMQHYERISLAVAGPLTLLYRLFRPFVNLLSGCTNVVLRLMGIDPVRQQQAVTEEEIRLMIDMGNQRGSIEKSDKDMINGIFEFDDRTVSDTMTHRTEVVAVEMSATLEDVVALAVETGYSRIPVYEDDLDSIQGILYVKDLLELILRDSDGMEFQLRNYIREPLYVPASIKCKALLTQFQQKKLQMAIVVDEYGGAAGLVTMEDLLESIVGNIQDEYDDEEEDNSPLPDGSYLVDGLTPMEDIMKYFDLEVPDEDDFDTIGGYVVGKLGRIPGDQERSSVELGGFLFTVTEVDERRIAKLEALRLPPGLEEGQTALEA